MIIGAGETSERHRQGTCDRGRLDDLRRQPPRRSRALAGRALRRHRPLVGPSSAAARVGRHRRRVDVVAAPDRHRRRARRGGPRACRAGRSSSSISRYPATSTPNAPSSRACRSTTWTTCRPWSRATSRCALEEALLADGLE